MYVQNMNGLGIFGIGRALKKSVKKIDPSAALKKAAKKIDPSSLLKKVGQYVPGVSDAVMAYDAKKRAGVESKAINAQTRIEEAALEEQQAASAQGRRTLAIIGVAGAVALLMLSRRK